MKQNLEKAIEDVFLLSADGAPAARADELVESICRSHALEGNDRTLVKTLVSEIHGERASAAPSMDNASLYRAPSDILAS
jgi:hypothetical protein